MWRNALIVAPTLGGVQILNSTSQETSLQRLRPPLPTRQQVWVAGDKVKVQIEVTWRCPGRGPDVVTYEISETARALGSQWIANATRFS